MPLSLTAFWIQTLIQMTSLSSVEANFPNQDVVCLCHLAIIEMGSEFGTIQFPSLIQPVNNIEHYGS